MSASMQSVLGQTLKDLELIIVDDASTDGTVETVVLEAMKTDSRVRYIKNDKHLGTGLSKEAGLRAATGDYIGFLDADDLVIDDTYEVMVNAAQTYGCTAVLADHFIFKSDEDVAEIPLDAGSSCEIFLMSGAEVYMYQIERIRKPFNFRIDWNAKIFRRDLFAQYEYSFPPIVRGEGFMCSIYTLLAEKCAVIDRQLFAICARPNSVARKFRKTDIADFLLMVQHIKSALQDIGVWEAVAGKLINYMYFGLYTANLAHISRLDSENMRLQLEEQLLAGIRKDPGIQHDLYRYLAMENRKLERTSYATLENAKFHKLIRLLRQAHMFCRQEEGSYFTNRKGYFPKKVSLIILLEKTSRKELLTDLQRFLESVKKQSFGCSAIETLIIGCELPDKTTAQIKEFVESAGVEMFLSLQEMSKAEALDLAIKFSWGEYVAFLASGEELAARAIEHLVSAIEEEQADFAYGDTQFVEMGGEKGIMLKPDINSVYADTNFSCPGILLKRSIVLGREFEVSCPNPPSWQLGLRLLAGDHAGAYVNECICTKKIKKTSGSK